MPTYEQLQHLSTEQFRRACGVKLQTFNRLVEVLTEREFWIRKEKEKAHIVEVVTNPRLSPMSSLEALFCHVDDFCRIFEPLWHQALLSSGKKYRRRQRSFSLSEVMTILIAFHQSHYRNFKHFYLIKVKCDWQQEFPLAVSYQRFVTWIPSSLIPLCTYLRRCFGQCTGISFIDATSIKVCHNRRISQHRVFEGCAARGKTSVGWFFGFKLHLVINERGELLNVQVTPGNTDDRQPVVELWQDLWGKVFADKGYSRQGVG
nr:IS982 family transposase [[Leptolyngbya] sp. PCC 7376]